MAGEFRVWDKRKKGFIACPVVHFFEDGGIYAREYSSQRIIYEFDIQQFTRLKDKNDEKIYIGDILKWDDKCTIVIKEKDELGFYYNVITQKDKNVSFFDIRFYRSEESAEIIGNIKENPELLRRKKWQE